MPRPSDRAAAIAETHISIVIFVGDRAYKLKKPVALGFLDFSTRELREAACHREVELNRRLAPDVYLGVADVIGSDGRPCDHLVVMRRLPADRRLATLIEQGDDVARELRDLARVIASFHAAADRGAAIDDAGRKRALRRRWDHSITEMRPFAGSVLDHEILDRVDSLAHRYLDGREQLLELRISEGRTADGHGDLLADDIFCLDDGPRVIDCIEFDDGLRYGDVAADVAFLAMDLERLRAIGDAATFLDAYREYAGETWPASLVHYYVAERALVRSKVACLRSTQGDDGAVEQARQLLDLSRSHLEEGTVLLVLVGGLPGTGKSTLAADLSDTLGWSVLRSDEVRKDAAGLGHAEVAGAAYRDGLYSTQHTARTYDELLDRAGTALRLGETVILDASWNDGRWRSAAREVADHTASELAELRCEAPRDVAAQRIAARRSSGDRVSDATAEVAAAMAVTFDPWPTSVTIDTTNPPDATLAAALEALSITARVAG